MKIIKNESEKNYSINTKEIEIENLSNISGKVPKQILKLLSNNKEKYPKQIAKELKIHEQNIYYYIKKLEKSGIIEISKTENINGTFANFYKLASESFFIKIKDFKETPKIHEKESNYLKPFIKKGSLNAIIIVGSPDPHGPQKARSRDGYFGMDLALFLGSFITHLPESKVKLDTEITEKEIEENNLIILGGPIVNKVSAVIGNNAPIHFDEKTKGIKSQISGKTYFNDEIGIINKMQNPFNEKKQILFLAGIRNSGTKAVILAFLKHFGELKKGNINNKSIHSRIVEGIDLDSDGVIDDCEFLE